ncbi:hypothetical protein Acor_02870 [Acrocarpospora corrugata]|uniref:H repeat-associated protein N-terminal domain-containing protein n=2 Tax=Acrocarpospora corrugata TaxID=35763 RepID=A0A5M3VNJ7_9ACTN|nr:hypothetical protein Acor_02870 [Acrocarpospora corrugata]
MPPVLSAITTIVSDADQHEDSAADNGPKMDLTDLRQVWAQIPDPRDPRGRRHSLVVILALVQAAIVSGAVSYAAIRHWIRKAPQPVLNNSEPGVISGPATAKPRVPTPCAARSRRSRPHTSTPPTPLTEPPSWPASTTIPTS